MHHSYQVTKTENAINLFLKFQEAQQKELKVEFEFEPTKYCIENISHRPRWKSRQRLGLFVWELQVTAPGIYRRHKMFTHPS